MAMLPDIDCMPIDVRFQLMIFFWLAMPLGLLSNALGIGFGCFAMIGRHCEGNALGEYPIPSVPELTIERHHIGFLHEAGTHAFGGICASTDRLVYNLYVRICRACSLLAVSYLILEIV